MVRIKISKSNNMMNVKLLSNILLCGAASLASIIISFACLATLRAPIGAIVGFIATTPGGIILSCTIGIAAIERAKCLSLFTLTAPVWIIETLATVGASKPVVNALALCHPRSFNYRLLAFWRVVVRFCNLSPDKAERTPFIVALTRAYAGMLGALNQSRRTAKRLTTDRAYQCLALIECLCSQFIGARTGTSGLSAMFETGDVCFISLGAYRALAND